MSRKDAYESPFSTRYASKEMQYLFSADKKFTTWRRLWVALARAEMEDWACPSPKSRSTELEAHVDDINYEVAEERERQVRHDVMSHVYAYGQQCPKAKGHHPPGGDFLLCGGQHRHHHHAGCAAGRSPQS